MPFKNDVRDKKNGRFGFKDFRIEMKLYKKILQFTQPTGHRHRQDIDAYLAGFFDGEGHISISKNPAKWNSHVEVGATQVDRRPLELLQKAYGGYIMKKSRQKSHKKSGGHTKQCFAWKCSGKDAMFALCRMVSWLIVKREKARAAIIILQNRPLQMAGGEISPHQKMAIVKALQGLHVISRTD